MTQMQPDNNRGIEDLEVGFLQSPNFQISESANLFTPSFSLLAYFS
jgi:hypothetical protein